MAPVDERGKTILRSWLLLSLACNGLLAGGCADPSPETASPVDSEFLDPSGDFALYVSNQSYAITPVDIRVEIDGEVVVDENFDVGNQHNWKRFTLKLPHGKHHLRALTRKGEAELSDEFEVEGKHRAVIDYWYYPPSHYEPTPRKFTFEIRDRPIGFM